MVQHFNFFYDESEHSRKINHSTIVSENYYDNFITTIVGWQTADEKIVLKKYLDFEEKYSDRKSDGELKSITLKKRQFKNGFASLNRDNIEFILDLFSIFDDNVLLYFSVTSKIEYIINQLFLNYKNNIWEDMDMMRYSIVKAIVMYQPEEIISGMYENTGELVQLLKTFFNKRINVNKTNPKLKEHETLAFTQILILLDDINVKFDINWNYDIAFHGFKKYLIEKDISKYSLFLDREGDDSNTLKAAKQVGLTFVTEVDSKEITGIRMADMLVGIISKLLKSLHEELRYDSIEGGLNKKILGEDWFNLNEQQLFLYKQLTYIICEVNNAWYKSFCGIYSDDFIILVSLLNYMSSFETVNEIKAVDKKMHGEHFNAYVCKELESYFGRMGSKLPIDPIPGGKKDCFYNQRGAKVFFNSSKQPLLKINEGCNIFNVLSVGFSNDGNAMITVSENKNFLCYRLPKELFEWAMTCVAFANRGDNVFPSKVQFTKNGDRYYVDVL